MRKIRRRLRRWVLGLPMPTTAALIALLVLAVPAHAWAPTDGTIAPGVTIGGVDVAGLTRVQASAAVRDAWTAPVTMRIAGRRYAPAAASLGQRLDLQTALDTAWAVGRDGAGPWERTVPLAVTVKRTPLMRWIDRVERRVNRRPRNARTRLRGKRVQVIRHRWGRKLRRAALRDALVAALTQPSSAHDLGTRNDLLRRARPRITVSRLKPVLVVDRSARTLTYWSPRRKGRTYSIAVGQPAYPTPLGSFRVVTKQVNPTWTPPDSAWAEGQEPIPPGPDNPLGTRWIGLSASGVGIHGTPNEGSVGTAASHGCMRMRKADVEQLFRRVRIGSPVHILR